MSQTKHQLRDLVHARAPLLTAIDQHKDAITPFAEWLAARGLLSIDARHKNGSIQRFSYDSSTWVWPDIELMYLKETKQLTKAKWFAKGYQPLYVYFFSYLIRGAPIALIYWLLIHR